MKAIAGLIGGLSSEIQELSSRVDALSSEMHAGFAEINARFDRQAARMDRHGALLQTGSRWVNQWAERVDRTFDEHDRRLRALEDHNRKREGGEPRP